VDGLTKISHLTFRSSAEEQSENYRKLLLSVAKDARVIIIKLADRLHNMRTLEHLQEHRRKRIATETREIYAPLAHRFGMANVKAELEDLAFKFLEPDEYAALVQQVTSRRAVRQEMIERLREPLEQELAKGGVTDFDVSGRPKHLWSIYQKMRKRNKPFDEIYDLMAMRVIVGSRQECYQVLGVIHHVWTPLQERFKDYIARPKSNGYQSLHTTIFGPGGQLFEIQIRTGEMHRTAEYGIAAHWLYKAGADGGTDDVGRQLGWFRQLLELQQESHSAEEFLEFLKVDLYHDEIFVFTPQGDVKQLPRGATAIDFAFHVHTDVGTRTNGAKVNGRIAPLHRELKNGDTVEVLTSQQAKPSRDWLSHVRTGRARSKIKQWIRQEEETVSRQLGGEILARELKRRRLEMPGNDRMDAAGKALNLLDGDALQVALGRGDLAIGQVMKSLFPELPGEAIQEKPPTMFGRVIDRIRLGRGIKIQGVDGLMVRYAQCCQPVPGDTVVGYVTQGRGISIHRADCPNLLTLDGSDRRVEIDWQEQTGETYAVRLQLTGEDRRGLYADVMQAISQTGTNIRGADLHSKDANVVGNIFVEVDNLPHLAKVLKAVRKVKGVSTVERRESPGA
jgi:GTP pyrophosphokinase